jgi:hypothetical protein
MSSGLSSLSVAFKVAETSDVYSWLDLLIRKGKLVLMVGKSVFLPVSWYPNVLPASSL